jgi:hypothetical protein
MQVAKALSIMADMVGTQIDAKCFAALSAAIGDIDFSQAA